MKHKEHILIGLLYLLSPFIGQLLVEKTYFIGTEFTGTAYVICWLSLELISCLTQGLPFSYKS